MLVDMERGAVCHVPAAVASTAKAPEWQLPMYTQVAVLGNRMGNRRAEAPGGAGRYRWPDRGQRAGEQRGRSTEGGRGPEGLASVTSCQRATQKL